MHAAIIFGVLALVILGVLAWLIVNVRRDAKEDFEAETAQFIRDALQDIENRHVERLLQSRARPYGDIDPHLKGLR